MRNPIAASWGAFTATLYNNVTPVGTISILVSKVGVVTGKLQLQGQSLPLKGALTDDGEFSQNVTLKTGEIVSVSLTVAASPHAPTMSGLLTRENGSTLTLHTAPRSAKPAFAITKRRITALFHPAANPFLPQSTGFGVGTRASNGRVMIVGRLPDNRPFAFAGLIDADGALPISIAPYGAGRGGVHGVFTFAPSLETGEWTGTLDWTKQPAASGAFAEGFTGTLDAEFSDYAPLPGVPALLREPAPFAIGDFSAKLENGIFSSETLSWSANDVIDFTPPNFNRTRVKVNRATGLVTGAFKPDVAGAVSLRGVIFQTRHEVSGLATMPGAVGEFSITQHQ